MDEDRESKDAKPLPAWLLGLIIAAGLFVLGLLVFQAMGFGDNPVIENGVFMFPNALGPIYRLLAAKKADRPD